MDINFFENSEEAPRMREDVRIIQGRIEVSPEARRLAVDLELTPFIERPTIELYLANERGEKAGLLTIIETLDRTIQVVMHFRDEMPADRYTLRILVYYASVDADMEKQKVDTALISFSREAGHSAYYPPQS